MADENDGKAKYNATNCLENVTQFYKKLKV